MGSHSVTCHMWVPVAVWQPCELLYTCYLLTYLLCGYSVIKLAITWFEFQFLKLATDMHFWNVESETRPTCKVHIAHSKCFLFIITSSVATLLVIIKGKHLLWAICTLQVGRGLGCRPSRNRIWCISALMTFGGNTFNNFPRNCTNQRNHNQNREEYSFSPPRPYIGLFLNGPNPAA